MTNRLPRWLSDYSNKSRASWIASAATLYIAVAILTRVVILAMNYSDAGQPVIALFKVVPVGFLLDAWVALGVTLPLAALSIFLSDRFLLSRVGRWCMGTLMVLGFFGILYLGVVEAFFFDEFTSRFNYVAVDYLIYPHEVFVNIWDSYPVPEFLTGAFITALAVFSLLRRRIWIAVGSTTGWRWRCMGFLVQSSLFMLGALALNINVARVSDNRILNEITANGIHTFFYSALTNELDYDANYAVLPEAEATSRLRGQVSTNDARFLDNDSCVIARFIDDAGAARRLNVVLVLEESFGSVFVGALHPEGPACTPYFDTLIAEGMLFSRAYATGNRTVRGIEASLAGFPPIPGQSVVKRPGGKGLFTLPSVLQANGYNTAFIYGGRSYFDNLGAFAKSNGFDLVIDQTDFRQNTFSTIWGVCDEDLFNNSLEILDSLHGTSMPFFATLLTVSNHRPYLYPTGRVPFDPAAKRREHAVHYADFSLFQFLRNARDHAFFDSTLFVVLGDHGARVYGSEQIPMDSYEIPILFYGPEVVQAGERITRVGSQMDLPSTILDVLNFDYNSEFFGRSLLRPETGDDWALLSHNRDVALLRNDTVAVLGIRQAKELWGHYLGSKGLAPLTAATDSSMLSDAIAYFQSAHNAYREGVLHPLPQSASIPPPTGVIPK